jgi:RNA polymerase sigma-70 factor (ECF subfamily)
MSDDPLLAQLNETRRNFLALVADIRPELHRYCARMTGSIADGEDVVQDTLARAYYELSNLKEVPALRGWLFRIAHNRALDFLRRYERHMSEPLETAEQMPDESAGTPEQALMHQQVVRTAISRFLELAPAQRSCVILKDVLGDSLEDIGRIVGLSVPAVKAALHRGRTRLAAFPAAGAMGLPPPSPVLTRYIELFNARDWDGVRAMLAEHVRLDVVSTVRHQGRDKVGIYFTNYDKLSDWRLAHAWLDGREVLAVFRPAASARPAYFIEVSTTGDNVTVIRDFNHVSYIAHEADFRFAD